MQNTYNEIGDTSVIFLHAREYLSYSLAMEKCWSNARILHLCSQQASTAACLNALCVTSSLAASLWCLLCVTTIPSHACFENSACDPPSSLLIVICHHSSLVIADSCFASCDLFFAILAAHCCHIVPFLLLIIMTLVTRCTLCYWSTINQQDSVRFTQD